MTPVRRKMGQEAPSKENVCPEMFCLTNKEQPSKYHSIRRMKAIEWDSTEIVFMLFFFIITVKKIPFPTSGSKHQNRGKKVTVQLIPKATTLPLREAGTALQPLLSHLSSAHQTFPQTDEVQIHHAALDKWMCYFNILI